MRVGRVARIRLSPRDCMAVVDILKHIGIHPTGMSFSQGVSITLSSALESFRQSKIIPTRDGFEYTELMRMFPPDRLIDRSRKLDITKHLQARTSDGAVVPPILVPDTPEVQRRRTRYNELRFKRENDEINMSEADWAEFRLLVDEFLPV